MIMTYPNKSLFFFHMTFKVAGFSFTLHPQISYVTVPNKSRKEKHTQHLQRKLSAGNRQDFYSETAKKINKSAGRRSLADENPGSVYLLSCHGLELKAALYSLDTCLT